MIYPLYFKSAEKIRETHYTMNNSVVAKRQLVA